jgi:hypothetical protein
LVDPKRLGCKLANMGQTQAWKALETFTSKYLRFGYPGCFALPLA